jgi:hypothetical protein
MCCMVFVDKVIACEAYPGTSLAYINALLLSTMHLLISNAIPRKPPCPSVENQCPQSAIYHTRRNYPRRSQFLHLKPISILRLVTLILPEGHTHDTIAILGHSSRRQLKLRNNIAWGLLCLFPHHFNQHFSSLCVDLPNMAMLHIPIPLALARIDLCMFLTCTP